MTSEEHKRLTVREACRRRVPLDGTDAMHLEHALQITERERDEAVARFGRLLKATGTCDCDYCRTHDDATSSDAALKGFLAAHPMTSSEKERIDKSIRRVQERLKLEAQAAAMREALQRTYAVAMDEGLATEADEAALQSDAGKAMLDAVTVCARIDCQREPSEKKRCPDLFAWDRWCGPCLARGALAGKGHP